MDSDVHHTSKVNILRSLDPVEYVQGETQHRGAAATADVNEVKLQP